MRENLKRSQLGSRVMFLAKCPDENPTNKALAKELVQAWSRWGTVAHPRAVPSSSQN